MRTGSIHPFTPAGAGRSPADAAACPACGHPVRLHNVVGCVRGECECVLTRDELAQPIDDPATTTVAPPAGRELDALDAPCARCPHRRSRHFVNGNGLPCRECGCRSFTTEATDAQTPEPAPVQPAAPTTAPADDQAAVETPRRHEPRPAGEALVVPAAVGEDDADEEVATSSSHGVATNLAEQISTAIVQRRDVVGLTQQKTAWAVGIAPGYLSQIEAGKRLPTLGTLGEIAAVLGCDVDIRFVERNPETAAVVAPDTAAALEDIAALVGRVLDHAYFYAARWYCPSCVSWPLDPGACKRCTAPLQPVYLATLPREINP